jgi:hypothetical protein
MLTLYFSKHCAPYLNLRTIVILFRRSRLSKRLSRLILISASVIGVLAICPTPNRATTIVVARSATEIVVGADSKVTDSYGNQLEKRACKILQFGKVVVAMEGLGTDRVTGFSVQKIVAEAFRARPKASISESTNFVTGLLVSSLLLELPALQKEDPNSYSRKIGAGQSFLRIVLTGFEKHRPLVFVRSFRAAPISPRITGVTVMADDCLLDCRGDVITRFLGETEAIEGLPEETADFWSVGLVSSVRKLVEAEVAARSEYVGPPIDIVRLTARGIEWIQRKPECGTAKTSRLRGSSPTVKEGSTAAVPSLLDRRATAPVVILVVQTV